MAEFNWKICTGFCQYQNNGFNNALLSKPIQDTNNILTDNHENILYFHQNELSVENFIEKVQIAWWDKQLLKCLKYIELGNEDKFKKYFIKKVYDTQDYDSIKEDEQFNGRFNKFKTQFYIKEYIKDNNLQLQYDNFIVKNAFLFNNFKEKNKIRKQFIASVMNDILDQIRVKYIYIYRDRDHKGILITKL